MIGLQLFLQSVYSVIYAWPVWIMRCIVYWMGLGTWTHMANERWVTSFGKNETKTCTFLNTKDNTTGVAVCDFVCPSQKLSRQDNLHYFQLLENYLSWILIINVIVSHDDHHNQ